MRLTFDLRECFERDFWPFQVDYAEKTQANNVSQAPGEEKKKDEDDDDEIQDVTPVEHQKGSTSAGTAKSKT